jgi:hypothetical protein
MLNPQVAPASNASVSIGSFFFSPSDVSINVGDTVTWNWVGGSHSTTSDAGAWDSSVMSSGSFQMAFGNSGSFPYHCTPHSSFMRGSVTVLGGNTPPTIAITGPANNDVFPSGPTDITVSATAADSDGSVSSVEVFLDNVSAGTTSVSPYSVMINSVPPGTHQITATATDNSGAMTSDSITVRVNVSPAVSFSAPTNNTVFIAGPTNIAIHASASDMDGTIASIQLFLDNVSIATTAASTYDNSATNIAPGNHVLTAITTDNDGATGTNTVAFIVNRVPSVSISVPNDNSVFVRGANISIQAAASDLDGSISQMQLLVNGGVASTSASGTLTFTINNATNGTYVLIARATDNRGAIATSPTVTAVATTINLISAAPSQNQPFQFSLSGLVTGKTNIIQGSTNLSSATNWISLRTNVAFAGSTNFIDSSAPSPGTRFYRVIQLP